MPDMYMDVDTSLAEVPVNIMPLIDDTDMKTIEGAVAYNAAGMALRWHFVTTAGAYTVTSVTPTTSGTYDWTDQGDSGVYTIEVPASGGASINNDTEGFGWFTGVATGVLPWRGPVIGFRAPALNNSLIDGGDFGSGTADSGSTTTVVDAERTEADTDYWKGGVIEFQSGNVSGQARIITGYNAGTSTITFYPATTQAIAVGIKYQIWSSYSTSDLSLTTDVGTVLTNTNTLLARVSAALSAKLVAHAAGVLVLVVGSGSTTTTVKFSTVDGVAPNATDNFYANAVIVLTSGALAGQRISISSYTGSTTTATVTTMTGAPAAAVTGVIV